MKKEWSKPNLNNLDVKLTMYTDQIMSSYSAGDTFAWGCCCGKYSPFVYTSSDAAAAGLAAHKAGDSTYGIHNCNAEGCAIS